MCKCLLTYLCCCFKGEDEETKRKRKMKTAKVLSQIAKESKWPEKTTPNSVKTNEMTNIFRVPEDFKTTDLAIESQGFKMGTMIGEGGFSKVHEAQHIQKKFKVAVKVVTIPDKFADPGKYSNVIIDIKNEIFILQSLRHPHIIALINHFMISEKKVEKLYVFMQYGVGGTLSDYLAAEGANGGLPEPQSRKFTVQILSALAFMKNKGIAHRDLKPSNILLDENQDLLIADFGLSRVIGTIASDMANPLESKTYCGTTTYMAPELHQLYVVRGRGPDGKKFTYQAFAVDVWALGVVSYKLMTAHFPFHISENRHKTLKRMRRKVNFSDPKWTTDAIDFIKRALEFDSKTRWTLEQLCNQPWVRDDYNKLADKIVVYKTQPNLAVQSP